MLEVLVTLIVVALALLGTAGLQAYAMRVNQGGQFRIQAVSLASYIAECMEANKTAAITGKYAVPRTDMPTPTSLNCRAQACTDVELAAWDISEWEKAISRSLPQASWEITQTKTGNPSTYKIVITWVDRKVKTKYRESLEQIPGETFSYTAWRTIAK